MHESRKKVEVGFVQNFVIGDFNSNNYTEIPFVYVKPEGAWPFSQHKVLSWNDVESFPDLNSVSFLFVETEVVLLFVLDTPGLAKPKDVIHGEFNEPYLTLHWLERSYNGPSFRNELELKYLKTKFSTREVEKLLTNLFSEDFEESSIDFAPSVRESRWLAKVKSTIGKTEDGHIEIGLPFKKSFPNLHSNIQQE